MRLSSHAAVCAAGLLVVQLGLAGCGSKPPVPEPEPVTGADVHEIVRTSDAEMVVVNLWATWCVPCEEEFPEYLRFARDYEDEGVRMVFVSVDARARRDAVMRFLRAHDVRRPTYVKEGSAHRFTAAVHGGWSGALPATLVYRSDGTLATFWEGKGTYARLERHAVRLTGG